MMAEYGLQVDRVTSAGLTISQRLSVITISSESIPVTAIWRRGILLRALQKKPATKVAASVSMDLASI